MRANSPLRPAIPVLRSRRGATSIEYGLIAVLIAVAAVVAIRGLGNASASMWGNVASSVKAAV